MDSSILVTCRAAMLQRQSGSGLVNSWLGHSAFSYNSEKLLNSLMTEFMTVFKFKMFSNMTT